MLLCRPHLPDLCCPLRLWPGGHGGSGRSTHSGALKDHFHKEAATATATTATATATATAAAATLLPPITTLLRRPMAHHLLQQWGGWVGGSGGCACLLLVELHVDTSPHHAQHNRSVTARHDLLAYMRLAIPLVMALRQPGTATAALVRAC